MTRKSAFHIEFDADRLDGMQWLVIETFASGFSVLAGCATETLARDWLKLYRKTKGC